MHIITWCVFVSIFGSTIANPNVRIIGGADATEGQFPYQVSIQQCGLFICEHTCGGSIISPTWIVSAGHCYSYGLKYKVVAGITNLKDKSDFIQTIVVNKTFVNQNYIGNVNPNDIAMFQLTEPLVFNENVQPISLPEANSETVGPSITSGWGQTGGNMFPQFPKILQFANVTIIEDEECNEALLKVLGKGERNPFNDTANVCTEDPEGGLAICSGDSGGPLVQNGKLIGISSWGIRPCGKKGAPSVFTKVSNYIGWIKEYTGDI